MESKKKKFSKDSQEYYIGLGMCFGVAFGAAFDNVAIGISMGLFVGVVIHKIKQQKTKK